MLFEPGEVLVLIVANLELTSTYNHGRETRSQWEVMSVSGGVFVCNFLFHALSFARGVCTLATDRTVSALVQCSIESKSSLNVE
jgi:hypothetical protein